VLPASVEMLNLEVGCIQVRTSIASKHCPRPCLWKANAAAGSAEPQWAVNGAYHPSLSTLRSRPLQCLRPRPPPAQPWYARLAGGRASPAESFSFSLPALQPGQQRTLHLQVNVARGNALLAGCMRTSVWRCAVAGATPVTAPPRLHTPVFSSLSPLPSVPPQPGLPSHAAHALPAPVPARRLAPGGHGGGRPNDGRRSAERHRGAAGGGGAAVSVKCAEICPLQRAVMFGGLVYHVLC